MNGSVKLNFGSGENKLEGFINVDCEEKCNPDLLCDIRKTTLPIKPETCNEVWAIHSIEHVEEVYWSHLFSEFYRVLIQSGRLVLAYPEFEICAKYYIENHRGIKDFWKATLYGRQLHPGDYHVTPVRTVDLVQFLIRNGFHEFKFGPEPRNEYYTIMECRKNHRLTKEDVLRKEIFHK